MGGGSVLFNDSDGASAVVAQGSDTAAVAAVNGSGWPDHPVATVRPGVIPLYLGEGAPLYAAGPGRSLDGSGLAG